ncbi:MAG: NUDIX hydrolase [Candidatus Shapirobacteria bacterium]
MKNPWKTIKKNIIFQNKFGYTFRDDDVITPSNQPGKYMVLEGYEYSIIVALTSKNEVLMTKQWRYPINEESFELPAGGLSLGETPLSAAQRELLEETGAVADNWKKLVSYWTANGVSKLKHHIFLAKNAKILHPTYHDATEKISVLLTPFKKLIQMINDGEINEERTLIGLLLAEKYI